MKKTIKNTGCLVVLGLAIVIGGCQGDGDEAEVASSMTKEEARAIGGKADNGVDLCELFGWYGDGICDAFCPLPDPDCGYCESNLDCDSSEFCEKSMSDCDGLGKCEIRPEFCIELYDPVCGCDERTYGNECFASMHGVNVEYSGVCASDDEYDPCGGKECGDLCTICDPSDPYCIETAVVKYCDLDGVCSPTYPDCSEGEYDPCGGKECGDLCTICDPNDPYCIETAVVKYCDLDGVCSPTYPDCSEGEYDPCGGKECGDLCTICAPDDPDCFETAVIKKCNMQGICVPGTPVCDPADDAKSCKDRCGAASSDQSCYCDELCIDYGDCCPDYAAQCL